MDLKIFLKLFFFLPSNTQLYSSTYLKKGLWSNNLKTKGEEIWEKRINNVSIIPGKSAFKNNFLMLLYAMLFVPYLVRQVSHTRIKEW